MNVFDNIIISCKYIEHILRISYEIIVIFSMLFWIYISCSGWLERQLALFEHREFTYIFISFAIFKFCIYVIPFYYKIFACDAKFNVELNCVKEPPNDYPYVWHLLQIRFLIFWCYVLGSYVHNVYVYNYYRYIFVRRYQNNNITINQPNDSESHKVLNPKHSWIPT